MMQEGCHFATVIPRLTDTHHGIAIMPASVSRQLKDPTCYDACSDAERTGHSRCICHSAALRQQSGSSA